MPDDTETQTDDEQSTTAAETSSIVTDDETSLDADEVFSRNSVSLSDNGSDDTSSPFDLSPLSWRTNSQPRTPPIAKSGETNGHTALEWESIRDGTDQRGD
jgi:hypothetical protein